MNGKLNYDQTLMYEPIVVKIYRDGQHRRIKTTRANLVLSRLDMLAEKEGYMWPDYRKRILEKIDKAQSLPKEKRFTKIADRLFDAYKNLIRKDRQFSLLLRAEVPHQKRFPVLDRDLQQSLKFFKKVIHKQERQEKALERAIRVSEKPTPQPKIPRPRKRTPAEIERQRILVYKNEQDFYIDENGQKVWSERAARMKNAIGMQKYFNNREKLEKYRRGERPQIEE